MIEIVKDEMPFTETASGQVQYLKESIIDSEVQYT